MPAKITPLGDRVLIKPDSSKTETNGIILPFAAVRKPNRGLVLAVGEDADRSIEPGMRVVYGKGAGTEIEEGLIVRDTDIFAIL